MARFENPNDPPQPQPGVYGWFSVLQGKTVCLYIGEAGKRKSPNPRGTLFRGVSELQRATFSSDSPEYQKLDTDFVVGTAIRYFEKLGHSVYWRHLSDDPTRETEWVQSARPILQHSHKPHLFTELKIESEPGYWRLPRKTPILWDAKLMEAETKVSSAVAAIWQRVERDLKQTKSQVGDNAEVREDPPPFALVESKWFAWQMIPGYVGERSVPYCSPIWVESVTPKRTGKNILRLRFINALYAEGVQDFDVELRILKRARDYLIAEVQHDRSAVISHIEFKWIEHFCPELWRERPPSSCSEAARASVSLYLDEVLHRISR